MNINKQFNQQQTISILKEAETSIPARIQLKLRPSSRWLRISY
ncbi:hypothetical protein L911_2353 [Vibrio fluvialis I21563]|nr:hypothetical protein L911_2353 [Vibrio fluvialis I21563]